MNKVSPKKYLGQHFLKDENIARKIVEALEISQDQVLIEVGPGTGVLTRHLLSHPTFYAFDLDRESIEFLNQNYPDHADSFRYADFLKTDLRKLGDDLAVIGNFPYNISSQLFFQIYEYRPLVKQVVCMIQKEVADRIVSPPGNKTYGILSVLLKAFFEIEYLFTVKPGAFNPPPKVNSAVIRLNRNSTKKLECNEALFKKVVKTGFGKRRKTLRNALKDLHLPLPASVSPYLTKRAEQLSMKDFIELTKKIENGSDAV